MRSSGSLEGTIVYLVKDEKVVFATEADANGDYLFTSIPYGSYNVKVDKVNLMLFLLLGVLLD